MICLIKSHVTGNLNNLNLNVSDPIIEDAIRFVRELQIVNELQNEPIREYE